MTPKMRMMCVGVTLLILHHFMETQSDKLKLFGPESVVDAVVGEDLVLPCFVNTSAVDMTVEWFRLDLSVNSEVHLYKDLEDKNENQARLYRGRTSLFKEELKKGNASLKLSAVRLSDEGRYKCLIEDKSWSDDIIIQVIVAAQGSHPVIRMERYDNTGGIDLVCESRGWNPEPEVLWLNREGTTLPAENTQIHKDTEGFTVKRRITVYDYSDSNRFYCRLQQKHHMMEAEVIINSKVFNAWKWDVGISVSTCLLAVGVIATSVICYRKALQKQKQHTELQIQRHSTEFQRQKQYIGFIKKLLTVDVTLDPETAHPRLRVSTDGKQVTYEDKEQENLTDTPKRFSYYYCVAGKQGFSSGRVYYEVLVKGKTVWRLGVFREHINRKEWITWRPQYGVWTMEMRIDKYSANADPAIPLTLTQEVEKVGVFVDYEEGLVSFYDVDSRSHIYSYTGQSFTEKLFPVFYSRDNEPLIITPVTE
ncbi:butyrophilin subfamily 1 member A1-like [Clarias gariepinus]|uniref:butyrophilin subfamily 1 member A1-like n=1 Tax=Clarias gariepinus TaxID=13013 RepID=UPI00234C0C8F|nr:butyrophilin subfamily 1 member A1-like [Clarias gariepinus]